MKERHQMYWIELEGLEESGELIPFPSQTEYENAMDWCNVTPKKKQIQYCLERGVDLSDPNDDTQLIPFWADISMSVYAWQTADNKMLLPIQLITDHINRLNS